MKSNWCYAVLILFSLLMHSCASMHGRVDSGSVIRTYKTDVPGTILKIKRSPIDGFYWNYYLFIPPASSDFGTFDADTPYSCRFLVAPNNSGTCSDDLDLHDKRALGYLKNLSQRFGGVLHIPVLVPVFPRPLTIQGAPREGWVYYTHALDRQSLKIKIDAYERIDKQFIAMIDHATSVLSAHGIEVEPEVFMFGFSASGNFTNRFVFLHPEKVRAAAAGGLNGMPLLPEDLWEGRKLYYPIGTYDIEELSGRPLDLDALRATPQYLFMGELDANDTLPYGDAFDQREREIIIDVFETIPLKEQKESNAPILLERFMKSEKIYAEHNLPARFVVYKGIGHSFNEQVWGDLIEFFRQNTH